MNGYERTGKAKIFSTHQELMTGVSSPGSTEQTQAAGHVREWKVPALKSDTGTVGNDQRAFQTEGHSAT